METQIAMHGKHLLELKAKREQEKLKGLCDGQDAEKLEDTTMGCVTFHCARLNGELWHGEEHGLGITINDPPRPKAENLDKVDFKDLEDWPKGFEGACRGV